MKLFLLCVCALALLLNVQCRSVDEKELEKLMQKTLNALKETRGDEEIPSENHQEMRSLEDLDDSDIEEELDDETDLERREYDESESVLEHLRYLCIKSGEESDVKTKKSALYAHNYFRKFHGVPALKWSNGLANSAMEWSKYLAENDKFFHSTTRNGENLAMRQLSTNPAVYGPAVMIMSWYQEIEDYDFDNRNNNVFNEIGHFQQVIWKGTKKVGCGLVSKRDGKNDKSYLTCHYSPPGNSGNVPENVPEPQTIEDVTMGEADISGGCDFWPRCPVILKNDKNKAKYCKNLQATCFDSCQGF